MSSSRNDKQQRQTENFRIVYIVQMIELMIESIAVSICIAQ